MLACRMVAVEDGVRREDSVEECGAKTYSLCGYWAAIMNRPAAGWDLAVAAVAAAVVVAVVAAVAAAVVVVVAAAETAVAAVVAMGPCISYLSPWGTCERLPLSCRGLGQTGWSNWGRKPTGPQAGSFERT